MLHGRARPFSRTTARPPDAPTQAETTSWQAAVIANSGTLSAARFTIVNNFIAAEKAAGTWALCDDYWGLWAENVPQALTSLKQLRLAVSTAAPNFTPNQGYTGTATGYIATGFNGSTSPLVGTVSNFRIAAYVRTNTGAGVSVMGNASTTIAGVRLRPRISGSTVQSQVNATFTTSVATTGNAQGYSAASRNGSAGAVLNIWKNGALLENYTPASFAATLNATEIFLLANNVAGTAGEFYTGQCGLACIGASLTAPQEAAQYANVQAWATAIGAAV